VKALAAISYGPPGNLRIIDLPIPEAGPGQIQVRIKATTINPTDLRVITGEYRDMLPVEFPYVPGNDFAGTVTAVGAGVSNYRVGDEVFGQALPRQLRAVTSPTRPSVSTGALAEYGVFEADTLLLAHRPASVTPEHAAALAISGMTARGDWRNWRDRHFSHSFPVQDRGPYHRNGSLGSRSRTSPASRS
jgi:NADPH:quinone reductase-like Zn-dependent oxidoreductase